MNSKFYLMLITCGSLILTACGSDSNDGVSSPVTPVLGSTLAMFGSQSEDDEPLPLSEQLETDIQDVFGGADNTSIDVLADDEVQSVIDRAKF